MLDKLSRGDSSNDLGPEHIIEAVYGKQNPSDEDLATMGLPKLRNFGSDEVTNYFVVIPLTIDADVELAPFLFDLPERPTLDGTLGELARFYDVYGVEELAALEGCLVPIEWPNGYPRPALNELREEQTDDE